MKSVRARSPGFEIVTRISELADLISIQVNCILECNHNGYTNEGDMTHKFRDYLAGNFRTELDGCIAYEQELHCIIGSGNFEFRPDIYVESAHYRIREAGAGVVSEERWLSVPFADFCRMGFPKTIRQEIVTSLSTDQNTKK